MKLSEAPDDRLVAESIKYRDEIAQIEARVKVETEGLKHRRDRIEAEMLRRMTERGAESIRTSSGTVYKIMRTSATVADWDSFFNQFVVPNQAWEFIERRANKTSVAQYRQENDDIPPGLNWREEITLGFKRS